MAETLKDYLLTLGFKVEKGEEARFAATLANIEKTMLRVAAGLTAAAATIQGTVLAVSASLDKLYWAGQRTGASVASMRALSYALSQVGGDANQAMAAFEGLASALRTSPGTKGILGKFGISTEEMGKARDTADIIDDIVSKVGKQPYYVSNQIASLLGVGDERAWNTFVTQWGKIREFQRQQKETASALGVDPDKAAVASSQLMQSVRQLLETVSLLTDKIVIALQPKLTKLLNDLQEWFTKHQAEIVAAIEAIVGAVKGLVGDFVALASAMKPVTDAFASLVGSISGEENSLKTALEMILVYMTGKWLYGILGVFGRIGGSWQVLAGLLGAAGLFSLYKNPTGQTAVPTADGVLPGMGASGQDAPGTAGPAANRRFWGGLFGKLNPSNWFKSTEGPSASDLASGKLAKITTKSGQSAWVAKEDAPQFQGFINDLEAGGYTINDLGGFSDRMIAGTNTPSQHKNGHAIDINPAQNDIGTGTGNLPPNTADLAKKWGLGWGALWRSKNDPMHFSTAPHEGGRSMSPEEIEQLRAIGGKSSSLMSPPPIGGGISRSWAMNQKTDITIIGSSDPAGTAAALGGSQSRLGAEIVRNAQSAYA